MNENQTDSKEEDAELERVCREESFRLDEREARDSKRVLIRITSYRTKRIDRSNFFTKYFIDACTYSGLIRDDTESEITEKTYQVIVRSESEERTEIEIIYPDGYDHKFLF